VRDELLTYYERELSYLRQMGAEFAAQYPKVASRLQLEPGRCEDPHVERLIEAVALLDARVHLRLDDDFPEITQALLNVVFPHYTRPIPSLSVVEMALRQEATTRVHVPRDTKLISRPVDGVPCVFRTCYATDVWPIAITAVSWTAADRVDPPLKASNAAAALRVRLECLHGANFQALPLDTLRFYLNGEPNVVYTLYELVLNNCVSILLRDGNPKSRLGPVPLIPDALGPVGFGQDEGMLSYPERSFTPYRLLQEYFAFPEKFLFLDLRGAAALAGGGFETCAEIVFLIAPFERAERHELLETGIGAKTLRLGATPVVNLFPHAAEPIQLSQTQYEYPVVADFRRSRSLEVFSIDEVACTYEKTGQTEVFQPFFSFQHGSDLKHPAFWHAARVAPDASGITEMRLSLVDLSGRPVSFDLDTLTVRCTCSNAGLPARLAFGDEAGDFRLETGSAVDRITALHKPTPSIPPVLGHAALWRIISHLSLNYLSLVEGGAEALKEMLRLYRASARPYLDHQIEGITAVGSERRFARVVGDHGITFVRGMRVEMEMDEGKFVGGGVYLFASVLEHFLSQYVSMNSFSQLAVRTRQRKEALKEWPPHAGSRFLL
jgi:type VI secretion system protein ImpG